MFKDDWEKTQINHVVEDWLIKEIILHVFPGVTISDVQIISGGCANINIKFTLVDSKSLLLRIYFRDKDTAYKEQKISELLKNSVPVPQVYAIGDFNGYRYAVIEFMSGITLRDFLLRHSNNKNISNLMYDCGKMLSNIAHYTFEASGFFDRNLHVKDILGKDACQKFIIQSLQHPNVIKQLEASVIHNIINFIDKYADDFPDDQVKSLVHGDYDPANILVREQEDGQWKICAVLDFEFAFSGTWLFDVANMLRYAHKMGTEFEVSFLHGIIDSGFVLPSRWRITINLLNLVSLLDCLMRRSIEDRPHQVADILELINYIVDELQNKIVQPKS